MKVKIEGFTREDRFSRELGMPGGEQVRDFLRGDPGGIFGQKALLGHGVEAAEQCQALVGDQRHNVAFSLNGPKFESERSS